MAVRCSLVCYVCYMWVWDVFIEVHKVVVGGQSNCWVANTIVRSVQPNRHRTTLVRHVPPVRFSCCLGFPVGACEVVVLSAVADRTPVTHRLNTIIPTGILHTKICDIVLAHMDGRVYGMRTVL